MKSFLPRGSRFCLAGLLQRSSCIFCVARRDSSVLVLNRFCFLALSASRFCFLKVALGVCVCVYFPRRVFFLCGGVFGELWCSILTPGSCSIVLCGLPAALTAHRRYDPLTLVGGVGAVAGVETKRCFAVRARKQKKQKKRKSSSLCPPNLNSAIRIVHYRHGDSKL